MIDSPEIFQGFCPIEPVPKGRPRFSRRGNYVHTHTPEKTKEYEDKVRTWMIAEYGINTIPMDGSLYAKYEFILPRPKSVAKKKIWSQTKPDIDNLVKSFQDAFDFKKTYKGTELGVIANDSRVSYISAVKRYIKDNEHTGTKFFIGHMGTAILIYEDINPDILDIIDNRIVKIPLSKLKGLPSNAEIEKIYLFTGTKQNREKIITVCEKKFVNAKELIII